MFRMASSRTGKTLIDNLLSEYKLVVVEKKSCPYCTLLREILAKYEVKDGTMQILNIEGRSDCSEIQDYMLDMSQSRTVPQMYVDRQYIGGATDVQKLDREGQLEGLLKQNLII